MGPNRIIHSRRGYLTEPWFDPESGRFYERPVPQFADEGLAEGPDSSLRSADGNGQDPARGDRAL